MHINNSRLYRFNRCRRKFFWNDIFNGTGLTQVVGGEAIEPKYLTLGKAVHHALALFYTVVQVKEPNAVTFQWGPKDYAEEAVAEYYREAHLDPETCTEEEDEEAAYAGKLVGAYIESEDRPKDDFTVLKVEEEFKAVLGEVCWKCGMPYDGEHNITKSNKCYDCRATIYHLVGRVDLLGIRDKHIFILDHKTVQSYSDDSVAAFSHSFQQIGYCYGYGKAHGLEISRFGINFLQKAKTVGEPQSTTKQCPDCRNGKKKVLTCETCNKTGRVERMVKLEPFRRHYFDVEDGQLDRYILSTIRKLRDIEAEAELFKTEPDASYPMEESACLGCKFAPLCWEGDAMEWYNPSNALLEGFECREKDYVDLASEEKV